jgi:hypothetical protein
MFGDGPAWQNVVQFNLNNVFREGDAVSLSGWQTHDTPTHANDWEAGIWYRTPLVRKGSHLLKMSLGFQRWRFPSVLAGTQDWASAFTFNYQTRLGRFPITVITDGRTVHLSPLQTGSLLFTQAYTQHKLYKRDGFELLLRHGPQHTYAWEVFGTYGHRVVRYTGSAVFVWKDTTFEAGYRRQVALKPNIPENNFWSFVLSRNF